MKKVLLSFSVLAVVFAFTACKKSNTTPANTASVMFVNAATGTTNVTVSANNTPVPGTANLGFKNNSGYQNITAGTGVNIQFSIIGSGLTAFLVGGTPTLIANTHYSVFAGGTFTVPSFVLTTDDLTPPTGNNAKIRFINLSPDNLNASCYIGTTTKLDSNIAYKGYSPFIEISPVTDKVTMLDPIAPANTAQLLNQTFSAGKIYTVMMTGSSAPGTTGAAVLSLPVISNN